MNDQGQAIAAKIKGRLIWPLVLLLFLNSLDRVNISFGSLQMNPAIGLNHESYGLGVSVFYIGYLLFQVPSTLILRKVGARRWLTGIVLIWGLIASGMAFIHDAREFYVMRILLGFAEAGFAPGVVYLCTQWMPARYRAGAVAATMLSVPIAIIIGGPLSGALMTGGNPLGLAGWRWMFLAEGMPTVALAFVAALWFVDSPAQAKWLSADDKTWLANEMAREQASLPGAAASWAQMLANPRVWAAGAAWFTLLMGANGVIFWLPQVIKQLSGGTALNVGVLTALPWIGVGTGMVLNGWHSDKTQERHWHVICAALLAAIGFAAAVTVHGGALALACLIIGGLGLGGAQGAFWTIPPTFIGRMTAVGGITLINMMGNVSGVIGSPIIGAIRDKTGSFSLPVYVLAALLLTGAGLVAALKAATPKAA